MSPLICGRKGIATGARLLAQVAFPEFHLLLLVPLRGGCWYDEERETPRGGATCLSLRRGGVAVETQACLRAEPTRCSLCLKDCEPPLGQDFPRRLPCALSACHQAQMVLWGDPEVTVSDEEGSLCVY